MRRVFVIQREYGLSMSDLPPINAILNGPHWPSRVRVVRVEPRGTTRVLIEAVTLDDQCRLISRLLKREDLTGLEMEAETDRPTLTGDPTGFRLAAEATRIRLAHTHDPQFAVSVARIDPLPHQLEAVYYYMLRQPRLRFLLADDPGAGKTIMAGLLLKELKLRGAITRTLIVAPANLAPQWQREMTEKFDEPFDLVNRAALTARGSRAWEITDQCVVSIDFAWRADVLESVNATTPVVVGNEVFGPQTVNLYDSRERPQPFPLGVGRRLEGRALRVALDTNLETYQYAAALALVEREGPVLVDAHSTRQVLAGLLRHARDRLAFNFGDAAQALDTALPQATGQTRGYLLAWRDQVVQPSDDDRLRELYFSAEVKRLNYGYAGWLERVFRFQESALRQAAVAWGVRFRSQRQEYLDRKWVEAQPGLVEHLKRTPRRGGGQGLDYVKRSASRPLLQAVLAYLAQKQQDEQLQRFLGLSSRLEGLADLRNDWVHRSQGVRRADLEEAFGGSLDEASATLAEMFHLLTGEEVGANPYDAINDLCRALMRGQQP